MNDPGTAVTARGLDSTGGADMATVPDEVRDCLAEHVEFCRIGWRTCRDCAAFRDSRTLAAVAIARSERERIAEWLSNHPDTCVYCGDTATSRDHLVPRAWTGNAIRKLVATVPACIDCNNRINAAHVFTIAGRSEVVATSLRRKWDKKLKIADRTPQEMRVYGYRMRQGLELAQRERQFIRARLIVLDLGGSPEAHDSILLVVA